MLHDYLDHISKIMIRSHFGFGTHEITDDYLHFLLLSGSIIESSFQQMMVIIAAFVFCWLLI